MTKSKLSVLLTSGFAVLCFLLPFVMVSCSGQSLVTLSGMQLVTGTTLQQPQAFGPPKSTKVSSEPMALIAVLCSCAVLGLALCKGRSILIAGIVAACAAVFFLFALKVHMESEVAQNSGIQLQWQIGFWLATILNLAAGAIQLFTMIQKPVASSG